MFVSGISNKIHKNIWKQVFENVIFLGFLMADTNNNNLIYIFCETFKIFTLYIAKVMFTYLIISQESHFHLQVFPRVFI